MSINITVQYAKDLGVSVECPTSEQFNLWAQAITNDDCEVCVRIVSDIESAQFNEKYRNKQGATNVLSFPFVKSSVEKLHPDNCNHLGDIVMAGNLINKQAQQQNKSIQHHWAHLLIHGILHLQGYHHNDEENANVMEAHEIQLLQQLGFSNPYHG